MIGSEIGRRRFLVSTGVALGSVIPAARSYAAYDVAADEFPYEVQLPEAEWRERLSDLEFNILRRGATEEPKSSPLWEETRAGTYSCKGCDLLLYHGHHKEVLDIGWVFFRHSEPNALLMGIDMPSNDGTLSPAERMSLESLAMIEVHCRRCGSHQGHIVSIDNKPLHCINGHALVFTAETG